MAEFLNLGASLVFIDIYKTEPIGLVQVGCWFWGSVFQLVGAKNVSELINRSWVLDLDHTLNNLKHIGWNRVLVDTKHVGGVRVNSQGLVEAHGSLELLAWIWRKTFTHGDLLQEVQLLLLRRNRGRVGNDAFDEELLDDLGLDSVGDLVSDNFLFLHLSGSLLQGLSEVGVISAGVVEVDGVSRKTSGSNGDKRQGFVHTIWIWGVVEVTQYSPIRKFFEVHFLVCAHQAASPNRCVGVQEDGFIVLCY